MSAVERILNEGSTCIIHRMQLVMGGKKMNPARSAVISFAGGRAKSFELLFHAKRTMDGLIIYKFPNSSWTRLGEVSPIDA